MKYTHTWWALRSHAARTVLGWRSWSAGLRWPRRPPRHPRRCSHCKTKHMSATWALLGRLKVNAPYLLGTWSSSPGLMVFGWIVSSLQTVLSRLQLVEGWIPNDSSQCDNDRVLRMALTLSRLWLTEWPVNGCRQTDLKPHVDTSIGEIIRQLHVAVIWNKPPTASSGQRVEFVSFNLINWTLLRLIG